MYKPQEHLKRAGYEVISPAYVLDVLQNIEIYYDIDTKDYTWKNEPHYRTKKKTGKR